MKRILILLVAIILMDSCNSGEDSIIIVPKDYTGYIIILYEQNNGSEQKYQNGKRIYEIPANGILKTQFNADYGWTNFPEFHYEKLDGEKIPFEENINSVPLESIIAFGGATGKANKNLAGTSFVRFSVFYIGNSSQITEAAKEIERLDIGSLAN